MSIVKLDYEKAKILMDVTTDIEKAWRATACEKEPWTVDFIERIPAGEWFIDAGANVGPYSLVALACGLKVMAVEPGYANYAALCKNLAVNGWIERPSAICGALGAETGFQYLNYEDISPGGSHNTVGGPKRKFHRQIVPVWALDTLAPMLGETPAYMKIDVDGGELAVVKGAAGLLSPGGNLRGLMIEMQPAEEKALTEYLTAAGWRLANRTDARQIAYGEFVRA